LKDDKKNYKFFQHKTCEFFPCHNIDENQIQNFNCLFCYCPLYALGANCGGNFYWSEQGIKVCTNCTFPHQKENYDQVIKKLKGLVRQISK
jgi:Zn-finger protein